MTAPNLTNGGPGIKGGAESRTDETAQFGFGMNEWLAKGKL
jgi:hypothetical protein